MVLKPRIRNEYHEAYRAGRMDEIPEDMKAIVEAHYKEHPYHKPEESKQPKPKAEKKQEE